MSVKTKRSGKATSIPAGLGMSLGVNVCISAISMGLIAYLLHQEKITWEATGYWIMVTLLISSFVGAKTAINAIKTQYLMIAAMSGLIYWLFLLCITALFFGGNYSSVYETAGLIAAGSICAVLLRLPKSQTITKKETHIVKLYKKVAVGKYFLLS